MGVKGIFLPGTPMQHIVTFIQGNVRSREEVDCPSMPHRLLLADDSVTIQRVIELTFAEEGVDVVAVGDGQQAIERLGPSASTSCWPTSACRGRMASRWRPSCVRGPSWPAWRWSC